MIIEKNKVTKCYNKLVKTQQKQADELFNLQREKEFEVQKLNSYYQARIDDAMRRQQATTMQVNLAKEYVASICCTSAGLLDIKPAPKTKREG
jgi:hypothetical protein